MRNRISLIFTTMAFAGLMMMVISCAARDSGSGGRDAEADGGTDDTTVNRPDGSDAGGVDVTTPDATGGWTIEQLQNTSEGLDCASGTDFINLFDDITLENVVAVTGVYSVTDTLEGFFVHDGTSGQYSGLAIVTDAGMVTALNPGDVVTVQGDLLEYYCNTQMRASSVTVTGTADVPAGAVVTPADIASAGGPNAEAYEGTLVTVQAVDVTATSPSYGSFTVADVLYVEPEIAQFTLPDVGCRYTSITGVLAFSFDVYRLFPTSVDDLVLDTSVTCEGGGPDPTTIEAMQTNALSTTCTDEAFVDGGSVILEGVEVASGVMDVSGSLVGYFVQEGDGGTNSGVLVVFNSSSDPGLSIGQVINLTGDWTEFYCLTEINATTHEVVAGTGVIEESLVTTADNFQSDDDVEAWEGAAARVESITISEVDEHGAALVQGSGLIIDGSYLSGGDATTFTSTFVASATFSVVHGFIYYSYDAWRLVPTSWE